MNADVWKNFTSQGFLFSFQGKSIWLSYELIKGTFSKPTQESKTSYILDFENVLFGKLDDMYWITCTG